MSYEKQTWECGETITAEKLNHMEDGIANSGGGSEPLLVGFSAPGTLNKTWQEIFDAYPNAVMYNEDDDFVSKAGSITRVEYMVDQYKVYVLQNNIETIYHTSSADGYPGCIQPLT